MKAERSDPVTRPSPQILLIDDEVLFTATLADILEDEGYRAITAPDGLTALQLVGRYHPTLVFLDLRMPGMSGEEVCRRLLAENPETVVVVLSATAGEEQTRELRRLGARDVLVKPVPVTLLLAIAAQVCRPATAAVPVTPGPLGLRKPAAAAHP